MDGPNLIAAISACLNPDAEIRKAGEEAVKQVRTCASQPRAFNNRELHFCFDVLNMICDYYFWSSGAVLFFADSVC